MRHGIPYYPPEDQTVNIKPETLPSDRVEKDLNGDEVKEILIADNSLKLDHLFDKSFNPVHSKILTLKDGKYVDASGDFKSYYQDEIKFFEGYLDTLKNKLDNPRPQEILAISVMSYLDYAEIGQKDIGFDKFWRQTDIKNWPSRIVVDEADRQMVDKVRQRVKEICLTPIH